MAVSVPKFDLSATAKLESSPGASPAKTSSRRTLTPRLVKSTDTASHVRIKPEQPGPLPVCDSEPFVPSQGWLFPTFNSTPSSTDVKAAVCTKIEIRFSDAHTPEFKSSPRPTKQFTKALPNRSLISPAAVPSTPGTITRSTSKALIAAKTQSKDKPNHHPEAAPVSSVSKATNPVAGPVFKPFCPKVHLNKSASTLIRETLVKPLTKTELHTVYLYVYWYPGNFGKVKIGSAKSVSKRFLQWQRKCKHPVHNCIDQDLSLKIPILHARRLEKLIHAELKDYRMEEQRCICNEKHNEWFETTEQHVKLIIRKWTDWINHQTWYEKVLGGRLIQQNTKETALRQLCQPIPRPDDFVYIPELRVRSKSESNISSTKRPPIRRSARLQAEVSEPDATPGRDDGPANRRKRYSQAPRDRNEAPPP